MSEVIVFTKRKEDGRCPGCEMLKRNLNSKGISYKEIPYDSENPKHVEVLKGAGFKALPVTFPNGLEDVESAFQGFAPNKIAEMLVK